MKVEQIRGGQFGTGPVIATITTLPNGNAYIKEGSCGELLGDYYAGSNRTIARNGQQFDGNQLMRLVPWNKQ